MRRIGTLVATLVAVGAAFPGVAAAGTVRTVGPGKTYAKPCQAISAAQPGDTIQIDAAGSYDGDSCSWSTPKLTIEGVNGRPHIVAPATIPNAKAIWVTTGAGTVIRNVELSGAAVPDGNGAGIRVESGDLTLEHAYIHDNQDGLLTGGVDATIVVDSSEFARNGSGDGYTHNIYIASAKSFTLRYSYSHDAIVGHLVKSRARTNNILYNRLTGEQGSDSYELDLPDGGLSRVVGNVIEKGPNAETRTMLDYAGESTSNPDKKLYVVNNTFVNDRPGGGTAVHVQGVLPQPATVVNNISTGSDILVDQVAAEKANNCVGVDPLFVSPSTYDYHLQEGSPCRDHGTAPDPSVAPTAQYVYDTGHEARDVVGSAIDAGALEWAPPPPPGGAGGSGGSSGPASPAAGTLSLGTPKVRSNGRLAIRLKVSGAGSLTGAAVAKHKVTYGHGKVEAKRAGNITLVLKPTRAGKRALTKRGRLKLSLAVRFKPAGAKAVTKHRKLKIRLAGSKVKRAS